MTDFRSVGELSVYRRDQLVGNLRRFPKGCEFRYTDEFLASSQAPIALHLPKTPEGIRSEGLANLPTYFAGLLPEGVMYAAVKNLIGSASDDLFAVLAATGADAIGDIDVRVPGQPGRVPSLDLDEAADLIESLLNKRKGLSVDVLSAIPGVQPKLSIGGIVRISRKAAYIAKFEPPEFPGLIENEFAFMRLAKRCGLEVAEVQKMPKSLVVSRFDRRLVGHKIEKLHVEDMVQLMDLFPNSKYSMEYGDLMEAMEGIGASKVVLLNALRLYVFSYIIGNGDLHAKNVSLIRADDGQWKLSPAYDLLSTLPYLTQLDGAERMALALADESFGRFTKAEFVEFGLCFALPDSAVGQMVDRTALAVLKHLSPLDGAVSSEVVGLIEERAKSLA